MATTLSDPNMVRFFKPEIEQILDGGVDLLFCNDDEALEYTGVDTVEKALTILSQQAKQVVITLGKKGSLFFDGESVQTIEPFEVKAVDTNGAGDMFAGAFMYGITNGLSWADAGKLASFASAHLVTQFGPRLKPGAVKELQQFVEKEFNL